MKITRRDFVKATGVGAAGMLVSPFLRAATGEVRKGRIIPSDQKMNIACIGCGGKGESDIEGVNSENIVGLCDVDWVRAMKTWRKYPDVPKYKDFRQMLIEMDDKIDAVTVSTPDHMHFPAAIMAISMGKHVYVQKPLTHTVWEARQLTLAAREHNVVTQMGNQGHAGEGIRLVREWVQAGVIGKIREVHIWTNRPIWPQGISRPAETEPVPETLDWNRWLGVAPWRPYNSAYTPFKWRGWWDFGCGALGDMGCHIMDAAFWSLDLKYPTSVMAESDVVNNETAPNWAVVTYEFPERGSMPPVTVKWYEGGKRPSRPKDMEENRVFNAKGGQLIIGENGSILDTADYCQSPRIIPELRMQEVLKNPPPKNIPRIEGDHYKEWIRACKGVGPKPGSNFDYAGPLAEMVLMGNLAIRMGKKVKWDGENMKCTNEPEANKFVRHPYRVF